MSSLFPSMPIQLPTPALPASTPSWQSPSDPQVNSDRWATPSQMHRALTPAGPTIRPNLRGLDAAWDRCVGWVDRRLGWRSRLMKQAQRIQSLASPMQPWSERKLREELAGLREVFRRQRQDRHQLELAMAMLSQAAHRALELEPHSCQIAASLAMQKGFVAELATGEGKTLSAALAAVLAGWQGRGCHVLTVNDYLAQRDAQTMRPFYRLAGLTVAHLSQELQADDRRLAYAADVTYGTNKEVAADYLRDRLTLGRIQADPRIARWLASIQSPLLAQPSRPVGVQRGLEWAIIDEADSILIDEAVTPLIISGDPGQASGNEQMNAAFIRAAELARELRQDEDYRIDLTDRRIDLTPVGREHLASLISPTDSGFWQESVMRASRRREEMVTQALTARLLFLRDRHYLVHEGKVQIIDEFTGRVMPDRSWRAGLHQAVEAKEGLDVSPLKETLARISFQRFFRLYRHLAGMTGTASEAADELWTTYRLRTVALASHRPCIRRHEPIRLYANPAAKNAALLSHIQRENDAGRPILIGSRSVGASERLSQELTRLNLLHHQVLNAVRHQQEAQIVLSAGQERAITVATNMAGRGTDIRLGDGVAKLGGLLVLNVEPNDSARIDRQLFGRSGRQGDPGQAAAYASLDDELFKRYAPVWLMFLFRRLVRAASDQPFAIMPARLLLSLSQNRAQAMARRQRQAVQKEDQWLDESLGFAGREHAG